MRYLCLVYAEEKVFSGMSASASEALTRDSLAYDAKLKESGHFLGANALRPVRTARTVRVRNGQISATDGPFAETKEHLCGYILIEAADLEEASRVAAGIPLARLGGVEVRPVLDPG